METMKGRIRRWKLAVMAILSIGITQPAMAQTAIFPAGFDWQGHRGARGLAPENTVPAFLRALDFPLVRTLEMDLAVSADGKLVVSHDPVFAAAISSHPDGLEVLETEVPMLRLYAMSYKEIAQYDVGKLGNPRFPQQVAIPAHKPTLDDVVEAVRLKCNADNREMPFFNIEIKSNPNWDGTLTPPVEAFAKLVEKKIKALGISDRVCVQSFDKRALRAVYALNPQRVLAFLDEEGEDLASVVQALGFTPAIYSPYYKLVDRKQVEAVHRRGMRIIPWTVNETAEMQSLVDLGVDGIITDYPNRIPH